MFQKRAAGTWNKMGWRDLKKPRSLTPDDVRLVFTATNGKRFLNAQYQPWSQARIVHRNYAGGYGIAACPAQLMIAPFPFPLIILAFFKPLASWATQLTNWPWFLAPAAHWTIKLEIACWLSTR